MSDGRSTLVIEQGPFFPSGMRILLVFVGLIFSIVLIGLPILAMAIYYVGTEIDVERSRIREYGSLFGLRRGKWKPITPYMAIVILGKRRVSTMYSRGQVALDQAEQNHDVTLVDATHRKKFLLKASDSVEEARVLAEQVANFTGFPIERYAPRQIGERRR
jgi:hypothetical protein